MSRKPLRSKPEGDKKKKSKEPEILFGSRFLGEIWSWIKTLAFALAVVLVLNGFLIASFMVPTGSMENTVMAGDFLFVNKLIYRPSTPQVIPFIQTPLPHYSFNGYAEPEKGDVIVFIFPGNRDEVEPEKFQYYLKRCVATEGDTLQVIDNVLFVNGKQAEIPEYAKFMDYAYKDPTDYLRTFPKGFGFTKENYGPIRIPKKGDVIDINMKNVSGWKVFIEREGHTVSFAGGKIYVDGEPKTKYTVERNYVFGMGDNRDNSLDSRYFGFIPKKDVVGTPMFVYLSWNSTGEGSPIRWNRFGKVIK